VGSERPTMKPLLNPSTQLGAGPSTLLRPNSTSASFQWLLPYGLIVPLAWGLTAGFAPASFILGSVQWKVATGNGPSMANSKMDYISICTPEAMKKIRIYPLLSGAAHPFDPF
jgi:hypothetical protein